MSASASSSFSPLIPDFLNDIFKRYFDKKELLSQSKVCCPKTQKTSSIIKLLSKSSKQIRSDINIHHPLQFYTIGYYYRDGNPETNFINVFFSKLANVISDKYCISEHLLQNNRIISNICTTELFSATQYFDRTDDSIDYYNKFINDMNKYKIIEGNGYIDEIFTLINTGVSTFDENIFLSNTKINDYTYFIKINYSNCNKFHNFKNLSYIDNNYITYSKKMNYTLYNNNNYYIMERIIARLKMILISQPFFSALCFKHLDAATKTKFILEFIPIKRNYLMIYIFSEKYGINSSIFKTIINTPELLHNLMDKITNQLIDYTNSHFNELAHYGHKDNIETIIESLKKQNTVVFTNLQAVLFPLQGGNYKKYKLVHDK